MSAWQVAALFEGNPLMQRTLSAFALCAVVAAALSGTTAHAFPPFGKKEGKNCIYCHVSPSGGKRAYRGIYYKMNSLSFANFDDAAEAKKAGVEIGPEATPPPASYTAPKAADPVKPVEKAGGNEAATPVPNAMAEASKKLTAAKAAYTKNPKDAKAKKAYSAALGTMGKLTMADQTIPPGQRYPGALKFLREAVQLDSSNKSAAADKKMIEDVYKQMGKPLPK